jgi:hypothetical protein
MSAQPKYEDMAMGAPTPSQKMMVTDIIVRDLGVIKVLGRREATIAAVAPLGDTWLSFDAFHPLGTHVPITVRRADVIMVGKEEERELMTQTEFDRMMGGMPGLDIEGAMQVGG